MKINIIDYGAGNTQSVYNSIKNISDKFEVVISNKISDLKSSTHFILPGVGSFGDCINNLKSIDGLIIELRNQVLNIKKPFLGICVGMQVLASFGYENGEHQGLGFINGKVEKIDFPELKVPHMGWNDLIIKNDQHPLLKEISNGDHFYFANSYRFICNNSNNVLGYVNYGCEISSIIAKENIVGVQFHPEKSGDKGLKILSNFLNWRP